VRIKYSDYIEKISLPHTTHESKKGFFVEDILITIILKTRSRSLRIKLFVQAFICYRINVMERAGCDEENSD